MSRDRITKAKSIVGGVRLEKVVDLMLNEDVSYGYVAGAVVRIRDDEVVVRTRQDAIDDFARRLYRGDRVLVLDHGRVVDADNDVVRATISIPASGNPVPIHFELENPLSVDDLVDLNDYFSRVYVLIVGKFRYRRPKKKGRGYLVPLSDPVIVEFEVRDIDVPELVQLFTASGMLTATEAGTYNRIRNTTSLDEKLRNRIIGLEVIRRFGRFGPAMTVQVSQPGYGKSSFYHRIRQYDAVSVFAVPPGKSILYSDERTRPPTPGRFFLDDVVVFDEVGDWDRSRHTEKASLIRPELKADIVNTDVARVAVIGNVITARGKPVFTKTSTVRDALASVFMKVGIRQLEGRIDRVTMALTAREESLHGKRSRSDIVLDPVYYRRLKEKYHDVVPRLRKHTFSILRNRLNEIGVEVDENMVVLATNPLQASSGVTVAEHMRAIETLGDAVRKALDARLFDQYVPMPSPVDVADDYMDVIGLTRPFQEKPTARKVGDEIPKTEPVVVKKFRSFDDVEEDGGIVYVR